MPDAATGLELTQLQPYNLPGQPDMATFLAQLDDLMLPKLHYPYRHTDEALIKLFLYGIVQGITGFKTLHTHLQEQPDVLDLVSLDFPPSPHHT
jgi:hypothetical protein